MTSEIQTISIGKGHLMNNKWIWSLIGLLSLAGAGVSQAQQSGDDTAKAVLALENQWLEADKTNKPDMAEPLIAEQYVATGADGTLETKTQTMADAKARKYTGAIYQDVKATVFGTTVIVIGIYKGKGTQDGKPFDENFRWTDTWVKMPSGKWQCVATQYTSLK
jgi:ketosteroid isomerase-like protein